MRDGTREARPEYSEGVAKRLSYLTSVATLNMKVLGTLTRNQVLPKYKSIDPESASTQAPVHNLVVPGKDLRKLSLCVPKASLVCSASAGPDQFPNLYQRSGKFLSQSMDKLPNLPKRNDVVGSPMSPQLMHTIEPSVMPGTVPRIEPSKVSSKKVGVVKAYAANTHQGIVRTYNEDRVSIILNIVRPANKKVAVWPRCALFGIYDGHGGAGCADFLRDTLHHIIIRDPAFPADPAAALTQGCAQAEEQFLDSCEQSGTRSDHSGSCAVVAILVEDMCYIGNVGDSRAVMSENQGSVVVSLSTDHKPDAPTEYSRIVSNGGTVYRSQISSALKAISGNEELEAPLRVFPGRLSVSRTFGDIAAKLPKYKGKPNVVIAVPDVKSVKISDSTDFILLGCDGIFDKLSSNDVAQIVWSRARALAHHSKTVHEVCGECVAAVLQQAMGRRSLDNLTVVMIAFKGFKRFLQSNRDCPHISTAKKPPKLAHIEMYNKGATMSFVAKRTANPDWAPTSPGIPLQKSLSPTQSFACLKKMLGTPKPDLHVAVHVVEQPRPALNFAGIKGLIELSKKTKVGIEDV